MVQITRRDFIKGAGGFVSAAALAPSLLQDALAGREKRFNILFLITDQHCQSVMGCSGNPIVRTPNLDRLAGEGARFTSSVCATPFCSPTRASFITGQWPHTHGIVNNVPDDGKAGLNDSVIATEQTLFDKGYQTFQMGKWHLGDTGKLRCYQKERDLLDTEGYRQAKRALPDGGWSKARSGEVQIDDVAYTPEMAEFHKAWEAEKNRSPQDLSVIGRLLLPREYNYESWLADRCVDLIRRYKDRNFMITYSVSPPHAYWIAPDPYYSMYDPTKMPLPSTWGDHPDVYKESQPARMGAGMGESRVRETLRCYYGQVTMVDWCIGRILYALRTEDLERDTLVVYTSDHGDMQGAHGMIGKSLPGYYDEIARTPLIMRYPGKIKPGTVIDSHVGSVDLMPTFLDYAGVPAPESVQGTSMRPLIEGKVKDEDRPAFCERGLGGEKGGWSRMVRTKEWKYAYFSGGRRELFNLAKDPGEIRNLAEDTSAAADVKAMHRKLIEQGEKTKDPALGQLARA